MRTTSLYGGYIVRLVAVVVIVTNCTFRFGRLPILVLYCVFKFGGGLFSAFAPNYISLLLAKVINGVGSVGSYLVAFILSERINYLFKATLFLLFPL